MLLRTMLLIICMLAFGQHSFAEPHPLGLRSHDFNGSIAPVTKAGLTSFTIRQGECSTIKYGDGRGEDDCANGNVRSTLSAHIAKVGQTKTYAFDFRVDAPFNYRGWHNSQASSYLDEGNDSRLRIAGWEGNRTHNFMYMLKIDSRRGAFFLNQTCVPAGDLHDWHSFRMEVRWANNSRGWIRISCDDKVIHFVEGIATTHGPHCYLSNLCRDAQRKNPSQVLTILGPVMQSFGQYFEDNITVQMRNVRITSGATLYDKTAKEAVFGLQEHLTQLGCDPGPIDGAMGARTRTAAKDCRILSVTNLPETLNAATVGIWLAAYREQFPI